MPPKKKPAKPAATVHQPIVLTERSSGKSYDPVTAKMHLDRAEQIYKNSQTSLFKEDELNECLLAASEANDYSKEGEEIFDKSKRLMAKVVGEMKGGVRFKQMKVVRKSEGSSNKTILIGPNLQQFLEKVDELKLDATEMKLLGNVLANQVNANNAAKIQTPFAVLDRSTTPTLYDDTTQKFFSEIEELSKQILADEKNYQLYLKRCDVYYAAAKYFKEEAELPLFAEIVLIPLVDQDRKTAISYSGNLEEKDLSPLPFNSFNSMSHKFKGHKKLKLNPETLQNFNALVKEGRDLFTEGKVALGVENFERAHEILEKSQYPTKEYCYLFYQFALLCDAKGCKLFAAEMLSVLLIADPNHVQALYLRGSIYFDLAGLCETKGHLTLKTAMLKHSYEDYQKAVSVKKSDKQTALSESEITTIQQFIAKYEKEAGKNKAKIFNEIMSTIDSGKEKSDAKKTTTPGKKHKPKRAGSAKVNPPVKLSKEETPEQKIAKQLLEWEKQIDGNINNNKFSEAQSLVNKVFGAIAQLEKMQLEKSLEQIKARIILKQAKITIALGEKAYQQGFYEQAKVYYQKALEQLSPEGLKLDAPEAQTLKTKVIQAKNLILTKELEKTLEQAGGFFGEVKPEELAETQNKYQQDCQNADKLFLELQGCEDKRLNKCKDKRKRLLPLLQTPKEILKEVLVLSEDKAFDQNSFARLRNRIILGEANNPDKLLECKECHDLLPKILKTQNGLKLLIGVPGLFNLIFPEFKNPLSTDAQAKVLELAAKNSNYENVAGLLLAAITSIQSTKKTPLTKQELFDKAKQTNFFKLLIICDARKLPEFTKEGTLLRCFKETVDLIHPLIYSDYCTQSSRHQGADKVRPPEPLPQVHSSVISLPQHLGANGNAQLIHATPVVPTQQVSSPVNKM